MLTIPRALISKMVFIFAMFLISLMLFLLSDTSKAFAYNVTNNFNYTLGAQTSSIYTGDGAPTPIRDGTDLWVIGLNLNFNAPPYNLPRRFKGTSFDNLVEQAQGTMDSSFSFAQGEHYWWNGGGWVDSTGKWYVITHIEFHMITGNAPMKRIGLSTSTDKGLTWHYDGDIITSDNSYDLSTFHNYFDYGVGEPNLYVDTVGGYFYVYYMNTWWITGNSASEYDSSIRVARSPISSKMAPGSWQNFYNGVWTQNSIGGRGSDVLPNGSGMSVVYNTYLSKYILITSKLYSQHDTDGAYMATATDLSLQNWTNFQKIDNTSHYNLIMDANGSNYGTVGQTFRWYNSGFPADPNPAHYKTITLGSGTSSAQGMSQQYLPRYSINDATPYWDWNYTTRTSSFADNFTSGDPSGWTTYNGTWTESGGVYSVDNGAGYRTVIENKWFDNLTYDADVKITNTTGNAGLVFRNTNNDYGADNYRGYYVGISGTQLMLGKADNSTGNPLWTFLATVPITANANTFYHLKVVADAAEIKVYFNNSATPSIDYIDSSFSFGGIGLRTFNTAASFDNVSVTLNSAPSAYTLSNNFSTTQGTNNWYYKQWNGTSYSDMTWQTSTGQWKGAYPYNLIWVPSEIHPDTNDSVVAWKAPTAGNYRITGTPKLKYGDSAGDGVNVKIMKNSTQVWPASGWQLLTVGDASDKALNKTATASSNNGNGPALAVDGNANTAWIAANGTFPQWLNVDLGSNVALSKVSQNFNETDNINYYYKIEGSTDNINWTMLADRTGTGMYGVPLINEDVTGTYRYVRLTVTGISGGHWASSQAFQVYSVPSAKHDISLSLAANDMVYFVVNKNGTNASDETVWNPTIQNYGVGDSSTKGNWHFSEGTGTMAGDLSGNGNIATLTNGTTWETGKSGSGVNFGGVDSYVNIPDSPTLENLQEGDYTLAAWFKPTNVPPGTGAANNAVYAIVIKPGFHLGIFYGNSQKFNMTHYLTGDVGIGINSASTYTANGTTWYHVVGVVSKANGTVKIYVNGVLQGTATFAANTAAKEYGTVPWYIGTANPTAANYRWAANGSIDEVLMYNRALSDTDVQNLYSSY